MTMVLCKCDQSSIFPRCDGSHKRLAKDSICAHCKIDINSSQLQLINRVDTSAYVCSDCYTLFNTLDKAIGYSTGKWSDDDDFGITPFLGPNR
jgi:hypothetical protein